MQMVMVTERVAASLANVLSGYEGLPPEVQRTNAAELQMSDLERKHGLLQARLLPRGRGGGACDVAAVELGPCAREERGGKHSLETEHTPAPARTRDRGRGSRTQLRL